MEAIKDGSHLYEVERRAEHAARPGFLITEIQLSKTQKVPYVLVVGDTDAEHGTVGVNKRGSKAPERDVPLDTFIEHLAADVAERR